MKGLGLKKMEGNLRRSPDGMEVPLMGGSDCIRWTEVSVPSPSSATSSEYDDCLFVSASDDYASSHVIGEPPIYFIWRIHKASPNVLELLQLSAQTEFPAAGLRFVFSHALSPFAFVFSDEGSGSVSGRPGYSLYAVTRSGVVYVLRLFSTFSYTSCSVFPHDYLIHLDVRPFFDHAHVTSLAASSGYLFLGRSDGSISCFRPAMSLQAPPGYYQELRDDVGFGRLWGLVSRGRMIGAVQDLFISDIRGRELMYVLHADGTLRVWDLLSYSRVFCHSISASNVEGLTYLRMWLGKTDYDSSIIPLAVLHQNRMDVGTGVINVYGLHFTFGDRMTFTLDSGLQSISLEEVEVRDVKFTSDRLWILKNNALSSYTLFHKNTTMETHHYTLQEDLISEQLFLSSKCCSRNLLLTTHSLLSSAKDQIMAFVSSIFLRRLLCSGVFNNVALRLTLMEYNKRWSDSEFESLSVDELKKEILFLVEHEVAAESSISVFHWWKNFCTRYIHHCCNNNQAHALLVQPDVVGLVRKNSVSLFRGLENIELSVEGFSCRHDNIASLGSGMSDTDREILLEVLGCIAKIGKQLGGAPCAIFYESFTGRPVISSDEIIPCLVKILESGYALSVGQHTWLELGADKADKAWAKYLEAHKGLRTFSIDILLSLSALCERAGSWEKVFTVTEHYLQYMVPKKFMQNGDVGSLSDIFCSILVQATSQFVKVMFESSFNILLFISYLLSISGQLSMSQDDICKLRLELLPMIQDIVLEWLIILFFVITPAESTSIEDFSSKLSSLQIGSDIDKRSWNTMLGKCSLSLAFILLFSSQSCIVENHLDLRYLPNPQIVTSSIQNFISWIVHRKRGEGYSSLLRRSTELALVLIRNGQSEAVECLLLIMEASLRGEKTFGSTQGTSVDWCLLQHLRGCSLLDQVQSGSCGPLRERKICEAIRCFFRASSGEGASKALHNLSAEAGLSHFRFSRDISNGTISSAAWKLHYYEWAMQIFERYNISEGACQFAFAALEQVDEALNLRDGDEKDSLMESATATRGRLWANVFKFTLDLDLLNDAYCAIISNPDEEIKRICLRRFIIVLFESGRTKILSDGNLPFIGLAEKITQELAWKAERSDIMTKPSPYQLLYAYEMQRHNWRMAASYMYQFSTRLGSEAAFKDYKHLTQVLQERLNGLSAAINALCLVHPAYSWIDPLPEEAVRHNTGYPVKRAKKIEEEHSRIGDQPKKEQNCIDIEKLQNEFVLTSAEYLLSLKSIRWTYSGCEKPLADLIDLLVQASLYDMAFTVVLKFWRGSALKRELEKIFESIAMKCCPSKVGTLWKANGLRHNLLLTCSGGEAMHDLPERIPDVQNSKPACEWEILELYLERYKDIHPRLPVTVAATLLRSDPYIELPLWLVHMFKAGQKEKVFGMAGQESSPASLFQLYVDCGCLLEATNLLLEYMELFASMKPADVMKRKKASGVWFPYTAIERLWCQLDKAISEGRMMEQCEKLKRMLHRALLNHLRLLKVDSDDAVSSADG